jgi:sulfofructose kinase
MAKLDVVGLGVSTVDLLAQVEHLPAEDEVLPADEMIIQGGGPVATALVALARLGGRAAMLDALGDDWRSRLILEEFTREKVLIDSIRIRSDCTSSIAIILVNRQNGSRSIVFRPGNAPELQPQEITPAEIGAAAYLHLNGRHWNACLQAARLARQQQVKVSFDGGAHRYRKEMDDLLPLVDICIVALDFARRFSGETQPEKAARALLRAGPGLVVVTDGTRGSYVFPHGETGFHQPAFDIQNVVDTTGCGDAYHGAFLFGLCRGMSLQQTAALASAVAALNTRQMGGRTALPNLDMALSWITPNLPD